MFNVPWGKYRKRFIPDKAQFELAIIALRRAQIELGDFREILGEEARPNDFIFLDPPYVPISVNSDFKRYTKDQFYERDHREMAGLVERLARRGCEIMITNSNHPLVHDLYRDYKIEIVQTRRNVNSRADGRTGEDLIINVRSSD